MKTFRLAATSILLSVCLMLGPSCATGPVYPGSPLAVVGADFQQAATEAIQAYAEYNAGNVDFTWAMQKMYIAYAHYIHDGTDLKTLIHAWTGNTGDSQKLADRIARIFGSSPAPAATKMAALAAISQNVAEKH